MGSKQEVKQKRREEPVVPAHPAVEEARRSDHPLARCRPRGDRVVVRRDLPKKETAGGILLPDTAGPSRMPLGIVISVGPGRRMEDGSLAPVGLTAGQRVILTGYAGMEIRDEIARSDKDEYVILREDDVLAVLD